MQSLRLQSCLRIQLSERVIMTKKEFLTIMGETLAQSLPSAVVQDNIRYYDAYFQNSGKSEEAVCEELGDPRMICRTIISSYEAGHGQEDTRPVHEVYEEQSYTYEGTAQTGIWDRIKSVAIGVAVILVVFIILGALLKFTVTVLVPIALVIIAIRIVAEFFRK